MGRAERPDMAGRTARSAARSATRLRLRSAARLEYFQLTPAFACVDGCLLSLNYELGQQRLAVAHLVWYAGYRTAAFRLDDLGNPVTYQLAADGPAGVGSASTLPRCAYQAATPMYGDHGMGVDRPSCTIAAFAPGR